MKYKRVLLKLSGESLGNKGTGISPAKLEEYAKQIADIRNKGVQVAIVIGGGNIFRGLSGLSKGVDRVKGDNMGMLATVINSIGLASVLETNGIPTKVLTSIKIEPVGELYSKDKALGYLNEGSVVVVAGGTGNPYCTTDTASVLRAIELEVDILFKGTRVDGVYTADPEKDPNAEKFEKISFEEIYNKQLKIMDMTAFTMCQENKMPIYVFDMDTQGNLMKLIEGEEIGTLVYCEK
jgi:uridylate kinase